MKALKKRSHGNVPLTLLVGVILFALAGCESPSSDPTAATSTATAEATSATDLDGYCRTICERTSRCGFELAEREAGELDGELVATLKKEQAAETERCVSACGKEPLDEAQRFQMERARVCLGKTDCDELSRCMAAL